MSNGPQAKADVLPGTLDLMVLQTLETLGLLRGTWGTTDSNRKARFYALTAAGRRQLANERVLWDRMASIMRSLLHGEA